MLSRLPPATRALLIALIAVFVLQLLLPRVFFAPLRLWPIAVDADPWSPITSFMPWQLLSYGFQHESLVHLVLNLICLAMFGAELEWTWGRRRFMVFYAVCMVFAGFFHALINTLVLSQTGEINTVVGASGAIFGLLVAYGMLFPDRRVSLLLLPVMMKARTLVLIFMAIQVVLAFSGLKTGESHFGHLAGGVAGCLMVLYWRRPARRKDEPAPKKRKASHLRVVK
ncbi:MAG: rhomboid family intramembrane serine protease [Xanthomonadaceae bacterium]|nr:rhomboid family intramembrane serine protease [Xanthomonadaceae bacterium]